MAFVWCSPTLSAAPAVAARRTPSTARPLHGAIRCHAERPADGQVPALACTRREAGSMAAAAAAAAAMGAMVITPASPALAAGFKKEMKRKKIPLDEYTALPPFEWRGQPHDGLLIYDLAEGNGKAPVKGATVVLHYDCKYRGLLALSSREARLLGGNRTIAEPFEMTYGRVPSEYTRPIRYDTFTGVGMKVYKDAQVGQYYVEAITKNSPADIQGINRNDKLVAVDDKKVADLLPKEVGALLQGEAGTGVVITYEPFDVENKGEIKRVELTRAEYKVKAKVQQAAMAEGNGLFSGASGPKPPAALFLGALDGMKVGGKRSVVVPSDVGYGEDGNNEIPPDADFFIMEVELLDVRTA